jgi:FdhD protein
MGRVTQRRTIARVAVTPAPPDTPAGTPAQTGPAAQTGGSTAAQTGGSTSLSGVEIRVGPDTLVAEEPLEIRVGPAGGPRPPLAVTMRTPGDDLDLAIGFLLTEGVIRSAGDVRTAQLCVGDQEPNTYNVVNVALAAGVPAPAVDPSRNFYTTSSCGVCGKASIDAVRTRSQFDVAGDGVKVAPRVLAGLPDALREGQRAFRTTGGLHAAGLFDADGGLVCLREDVGRHNAVDKVVGWAARQGRLPLAGHVLMVSGRASFELCQKAWMAGIPVLAAVSAPSTLAVDVAVEGGLTLIGFLRGQTFNVYAGAQRVAGLEHVAGPAAGPAARSAAATAATGPGPGSAP